MSNEETARQTVEGRDSTGVEDRLLRTDGGEREPADKEQPSNNRRQPSAEPEGQPSQPPHSGRPQQPPSQQSQPPDQPPHSQPQQHQGQSPGQRGRQPQSQRGGNPPGQQQRRGRPTQQQPRQGGHQQPQQGGPQQQPPRQGRHPQQSGQPQAGNQPPGRPPQGPGGTPTGGDDDSITEKFTRRQLLAGGGGLAAVGALGGWWLFLRGPSGAKGVVNEYYSAVDDGDLEALANVFHEETGAYERYSEATDPADVFGEYIEDVSFSVQGLYEMAHYTDPQDRNIDPVETGVTEVKEIMGVVEIDESAVPEEEQFREDETVYKETDSFTTVLTDEDEWKLWD